MNFKKGCCWVLWSLVSLHCFAQSNPDKIFSKDIHTVLLHPVGQPLAIPAIHLNTTESLLLSFDDFNTQYQDYYYSIELVDTAWQPVGLNDFDYVKGFNENRITQFAVSSIATQKYIHYQLSFPNNNCSPKLSGNYILKVYKNGNKEAPIITRRFYVVEEIVNVVSSVHEPFDGNISRTHQKIKASVDIKSVPYFQSDLLRLKVIQNYRYNDAQTASAPSFMRNTVLEFNNESELVFPGGKEARWLDIQSLRLKSDRVAAFDNNELLTKVIVKPDIARTNLLYSNFNDLNGGFLIRNTEAFQSEIQNDYAQVVFTYLPKDGIPLLDQKLYLSGALTNNELNEAAEMRFDAKLGAYQKTILLKQGYYSYNYVLRDRNEPNPMNDFSDTEGDHWETENNYTVLVYYRAPGARYDQIIGFASVNSKQN